MFVVSKINLAVEHKFGSSCQIYVVVGLVPFNVQLAAVHHDGALAAGTACKSGRHSRGTCSRAACHGHSASSCLSHTLVLIMSFPVIWANSMLQRCGNAALCSSWLPYFTMSMFSTSPVNITK